MALTPQQRRLLLKAAADRDAREFNQLSAQIFGRADGRRWLELLRGLTIELPTHRRDSMTPGPQDEALFMAFRDGQNHIARQCEMAKELGEKIVAGEE